MEPWFGAGLRSSMAVQMEDIVHGTLTQRRKVYYDETGEDVRLRVPGVRWADVTKRRRDILENVRSNIQEAFDKVYEQLVENRRVSINRHVLPTIKTPGAVKKTKSCTQPPQTDSSPGPPPPPSLSPLPNTANTPLSEVFTPRSVAHMNTEHTPKHTRASVSTVDAGEVDKENVALTTNTTDGPKSHLRKTRARNPKLDVLVCEEIDTDRVTRSSARGRLPKSPLVAPPPASQRATRSRTRGVRNRKAQVADMHASREVGGDEIDTGEKTTDVVDNTVGDKCDKEVFEVAGSRESAKKADTVSPNDSTTRRSSCNPAHPDTVDLTNTSPPLRHSQRCQLSRTPPTTTSTSPHSTPVVGKRKSLPVATTTLELSDTNCSMPATAKRTTIKRPELNMIPVQKSPPTSTCTVLCVTSVAATDGTDSSPTKTPLQPVCVTPLTTQQPLSTPNLTSSHPPTKWYTAPTSHGQSTTTATNTALIRQEQQSSFVQYHTPEWSTVPQQPGSPARSGTETKRAASNTARSDRGISTNGEGRERWSGSLMGGKRLRSVSLEKLSLNGLEAKKMSLCCPSVDVPGVGVGQEVNEGGTPMDTSIGQDPEVFNCEDNVVCGDSENSSSPSGSGSSDDHSASTDSQDSMETSPTVVSEPLSGSSGKSSPGSSPGSTPGEEVATSPTHLQLQHPTVQDLPAVEESMVEPATCIRKSPVLSLKKTKASPWAFLSHKTHFHDIPLKSTLLPTGTTFLSPEASPRRPEGVGKVLSDISQLPLSFLPKGSPQQMQKAETNAVRHRKLMEHVQHKREEEEQRKRELEEKKQREVEQRKRRNAERALKVAEKRKIEEEKKLMQRKKQESEHEEMLKKQKQLKENERKTKSKKHNDHVAAVRARKKQEEEQKAKKLQQLEEDRKMAEELHKQRLEKEEDERQARRAEKVKQERERQVLKEAEERERLAKELEAADKPEPEDVAVEPKSKPARPELRDKKNAFKQLLASTCTVNMPVSTGRFITEWKNKTTATVTKSQPSLPHKLHNISLETCPPPLPCDSSKEDTCAQTSSDVNTTFTVDASSSTEVITTKDMLVTPNKSTMPPTCDSYKMTPSEPRSSNYDIDNLSSGDSTDEEDNPKKPIPSWAATTQLRPYMISQEESVYARIVDPSAIFPSAELLREVDLSRIFKMKRKRFFHRTSSARWDSPVLLKKGKISVSFV